MAVALSMREWHRALGLSRGLAIALQWSIELMPRSALARAAASGAYHECRNSAIVTAYQCRQCGPFGLTSAAGPQAQTCGLLFAGGRRRGIRGPLGLTRRWTRIATAGFASLRNRVNSNVRHHVPAARTPQSHYEK
jgi:hypothetical protein